MYFTVTNWSFYVQLPCILLLLMTLPVSSLPNFANSKEPTLKIFKNGFRLTHSTSPLKNKGLVEVKSIPLSKGKIHSPYYRRNNRHQTMEKSVIVGKHYELLVETNGKEISCRCISVRLSFVNATAKTPSLATAIEAECEKMVKPARAYYEFKVDEVGEKLLIKGQINIGGSETKITPVAMPNHLLSQLEKIYPNCTIELQSTNFEENCGGRGCTCGSRHSSPCKSDLQCQHGICHQSSMSTRSVSPVILFLLVLMFNI